MPENKFDLNKALQAAKLYNKIDYGNLYVPDVQQTMDNFENWRKSQGYKTEEEKKKQLEEEKKKALDKSSQIWADLGNSEDVYEWYNAHESDPQKQEEFRRNGEIVAGIGSTIATLPFTAGMMGWVPAITTTATGTAGGYAGAYGGQKLGQYLDDKYGTNTTPWLSTVGGLAGGILSGGLGYKNLVRAGANGWLKGSGNMYGNRFISDVAGEVAKDLDVILPVNTPHIGGRYGTYIPSTTMFGKTNYKMFERPSKLTLAERMGIPKGDRGNLTQDQLEGLEDLMHYNTSGKHRWHLTYNDETGFARTTVANRPEGSIHGVQAMVNRGATQRGENGPMGIATKTGNWTIWPTRKNFPAAFSGGDFPTPEGMGWAPGDLSLMLDGNTGKGLKVVMTSPRVDLANNLDDASQTLLESLPNTIDKNIMRRFWQNNDQVILPGSYLSGDNGTLPLGLNGISAIDQGKGMSGAISEILHPVRFRPHGSGLSPDSMLSILKQGQRPGHAVRYGPGFTQLNSSAVYNKHIYDAWAKYKSGAMTADEFKTIFDDWFVPQGGRPLEIRTPNKFRWVRNNDGTKTLVQQEQTPYVVFPHPYVHYKKKGGKIENPDH